MLRNIGYVKWVGTDNRACVYDHSALQAGMRSHDQVPQAVHTSLTYLKTPSTKPLFTEQ